MWRSFSQSDGLMYWMHQHFAWSGWGPQFSDHHFVNILGEGGVCIALAAWFARAQKTRMIKWGMLATYGGVLVWGIHEGYWWLIYLWLWAPSPIILSGWGEMIVFTLAVMTPVLGLYFPKRFILWMGTYYAVWVLAGFPITESFLGSTPLYHVLSANLWEDGSWVWAFVGFYWLERDRLLGWYVKVRSVAFSLASSQGSES